MFPAGETGFISIFVPLVILSMLTVSAVIFDICEIAVMRVKFIPCDMVEGSFET